MPPSKHNYTKHLTGLILLHIYLYQKCTTIEHTFTQHGGK